MLKLIIPCIGNMHLCFQRGFFRCFFHIPNSSLFPTSTDEVKIFQDLSALKECTDSTHFCPTPKGYHVLSCTQCSISRGQRHPLFPGEGMTASGHHSCLPLPYHCHSSGAKNAASLCKDFSLSINCKRKQTQM